jgi:hypothetical protein
MARERDERVGTEWEPVPLELPLIEPTRLPPREQGDEDPATDAGNDRPRVIVIDLC